MNCPTCKNVSLMMSERLGVEIDYCPTCRGVWLDRGELDKIIELSLAARGPQAIGPQVDPRMTGHGRDHDDDHDEHGGFFGGQGDHRYKKKSWLRELFD
jgi:uncharacterized protein